MVAMHRSLLLLDKRSGRNVGRQWQLDLARSDLLRGTYSSTAFRSCKDDIYLSSLDQDVRIQRVLLGYFHGITRLDMLPPEVWF